MLTRQTKTYTHAPSTILREKILHVAYHNTQQSRAFDGGYPTTPSTRTTFHHFCSYYSAKAGTDSSSGAWKATISTYENTGLLLHHRAALVPPNRQPRSRRRRCPPLRHHHLWTTACPSREATSETIRLPPSKKPLVPFLVPSRTLPANNGWLVG